VAQIAHYAPQMDDSLIFLWLSLAKCMRLALRLFRDTPIKPVRIFRDPGLQLDRLSGTLFHTAGSPYTLPGLLSVRTNIRWLYDSSECISTLVKKRSHKTRLTAIMGNQTAKKFQFQQGLASLPFRGSIYRYHLVDPGP
jgi:hypothetical protein